MNTKEIIFLLGSLFILGMAIALRITEGSAGGYAIMCIPAAFYLLLYINNIWYTYIIPLNKVERNTKFHIFDKSKIEYRDGDNT